jgi:glutamine amidotransferase
MTSKSVHIVDYGLGNLGSIVNMFRRIGVKAILSSDIQSIEGAERLLIPGVGSFDQGIKNMQSRNILKILNQKVMVDKTPVLGICLGMQLMTQSSDEGLEAGLGWVNAKTLKMRNALTLSSNAKLPHVSWNFVDLERPHPLFMGMDNDSRFYFVHSYYVECQDSTITLASTDYEGLRFTSVFADKNIAGAQFHPEKSHRFGMQLLKNFMVWSP